MGLTSAPVDGRMEAAGRIPAAEAKTVPKTAEEAAYLFADIADTFAAALPSFLSAVLRAPPAFVVARLDTAPDTVSDIPRVIALGIASETRAASCALHPIGSPLGSAFAVHPAGSRLLVGVLPFQASGVLHFPPAL